MVELEGNNVLQDWVAISSVAFKDGIAPRRLMFMVSWNSVRHVVGVMCRANSRVASDVQESFCRSTTFTLHELKAIDRNLSTIHPDVHQHFPCLPQQPEGIWKIFYSCSMHENADEMCVQLEGYFTKALEICREQLFMSVVFNELDIEPYYETLGELWKNRLYGRISQFKDELMNVDFEREFYMTVEDMSEVYGREDKVLDELLHSITQLYDWQLQPFLDLRQSHSVSKLLLSQLSLRGMQMVRESLHNADVGPRIKNEARLSFEEWHRQHVQALDVIQPLRATLYSQTMEVYQGALGRMDGDCKRFGKTAFDLVALDRMLRLKESFHSEHLKMLQSKQKQLVQNKAKIDQQMACVKDSGEAHQEMEPLQESAYRCQSGILQTRINITCQREHLLQTQLQGRWKQLDDLAEDSLAFYDTVEDVSLLTNLLDDNTPATEFADDPQVLRLLSELSVLRQKRARFRTSMKRDQKKADNLLRKDFIDEERRKTIERLKSYRVKHPSTESFGCYNFQKTFGQLLSECSAPNSCDGHDESEHTSTQPLDSTLAEKSCESLMQGGRLAKRAEFGDKGNSCVKCRSSSEMDGHYGDALSLPPPPPPPTLSIQLQCSERSTKDYQSACFKNALAEMKKKLKACAANRSDVRKLAAGVIDLRDIQTGRRKLRKPIHRQMKELPVVEDPLSCMFAKIRSGINLKKVPKNSPPIAVSMGDTHHQLLLNALANISRVTREASPDSDDVSDSDFDFL